MATTVKVSSKNQIAVPAAARRQLGIRGGDTLRVEVRDGTIVLTPQTESYVDRGFGLFRDFWDGTDAQEFVRRERASWRD
jgi:AbrB family looped-hinge helix DNA binding protein